MNINSMKLKPNIVITSANGEYIEEIDFYNNSVRRDSGVETYSKSVKDPRKYIKTEYGEQSNLWLRHLDKKDPGILGVFKNNLTLSEEKLKNTNLCELLREGYFKFIVETNVQSPFLDVKKELFVPVKYLSPIAEYSL